MIIREFNMPNYAHNIGPYRTPDPPYVLPRMKRMERRKARLRGLWRRIVLPTKVVCAIAGLALVINTMMYGAASNQLAWADAQARRHADDWEAAAAAKQRAADTRMAEVERAERELNTRIRNFEDVLSMSPLLMKDGNAAPLLDAIRKSKSDLKLNAQ